MYCTRQEFGIFTKVTSVPCRDRWMKAWLIHCYKSATQWTINASCNHEINTIFSPKSWTMNVILVVKVRVLKAYRRFGFPNMYRYKYINDALIIHRVDCSVCRIRIYLLPFCSCGQSESGINNTIGIRI
jgi:hypothetical protein